MIRSVWFIVMPIAGGYAGRCKAGDFFGKTRMDLISLMLSKTSL